MIENRGQIYYGEVQSVVSGDDLIVMVDLGVEQLYKKQRIRLHEVDTPNAISAGNDTVAGQVRSWVKNLTRGRRLKIAIQRVGANSWVAVVEVETPEGLINLNQELVKQGYEFQRRG